MHINLYTVDLWCPSLSSFLLKYMSLLITCSSRNLFADILNGHHRCIFDGEKNHKRSTRHKMKYEIIFNTCWTSIIYIGFRNDFLWSFASLQFLKKIDSWSHFIRASLNKKIQLKNYFTFLSLLMIQNSVLSKYCCLKHPSKNTNNEKNPL